MRLLPQPSFLVRLFACIGLPLAALAPLAWAQDPETPPEDEGAVANEESAEEESEEDKPLMSKGTFGGLAFRSIGPALMSGRIADIAIHPEDTSTWYVAVGSGGVWKTDNAGTTWKPIFDKQGSYSIGCLAIDPQQPSTVWVGTGENVGGRHVGYGDGVYRSLDGGVSWKNMGLKASEHIGSIVIDPRDSDVVYVAAQGPLWSAGGERGVYKTTDGGASWNLVLGKGEYTGANGVVMDPQNPDVLYAALHQRYRNVAALLNAGPESGIHKSTDGGATWTELKQGLPSRDMGKIGLAVSPFDSSVVYATIELGANEGGFYRSADGGARWEKRNDYLSGGTGPHYYQEIFASPHQFDRVYQMDVRLHVTDDGGRNFRSLSDDSKHVDNHALAFHPTDPDYLLVGCDGGLYETYDHGENYRFFANLPITQFYKVAVDDDEPYYNVYGGTQDNNSQGGPSRTLHSNGITNREWFVTLFGDGHQSATEPGNPDIVYAEWQRGNLCRYDRTTGEIVYIQPQPAEDEPSERFNWDAPILVSAHDPARIYFASQRVWRSDNRGDEWTPISGDLTRGLDRLTLPMMGRVPSVDAAWDLRAMSEYGTITSLAESPVQDGILYAGTDDGFLQVSQDGGANWRRIEALPGVPDQFFVNDIKADRFDAHTAYVCVDNHKAGDFAPYVLMTRDLGQTWTNLAKTLPERHLVWRLVQDHVNPELLFLGTEFGVFFSVDRGQNWIELDGGLPNIPVRDLTIQQRENDLVLATFGRSFYVLDDYRALRGISEERLSQPALLFDVRDPWWYIQRRPLGGGKQASQGNSFYVADNPDFGATFTYYVKEGLKTAQQERQKAEKKLAKEGKDTPTPGWDALLEETREPSPAMVLTVRDAEGRVVRTIDGPAGKGFHRVTWNLRRAGERPYPRQRETADFDTGDGGGALVAPGTYSVHLAQRHRGVTVDLGLSQTFEVKPLGGGALPGATPEQVAQFYAQLSDAEARAATLDTLLREGLQEARAALWAAQRIGRTDWNAQAREIERRLLDMQIVLDGDPRRNEAGDPGPRSLRSRLWVGSMGTSYSTYGPTPTHSEALAIAQRGLDRLETNLGAILNDELPALRSALEKAGAPWTPGRGLAPR